MEIFIYLGHCPPDGLPNAPASYLLTVISTVVDSAAVAVAAAAAAEYAALFINPQTATFLRQALLALGYPQKESPITYDNMCTIGIDNNLFTQKRSKTIDMRYHWTQHQIVSGHLTVTWEAGKFSLADFFTKAHLVSHHLYMINTYLVPE